MISNKTDQFVLATLDYQQANVCLWLGQGDFNRGIRRAINFVDAHAFNYPTPPALSASELGERFNPEKDYREFYSVNPAEPEED